MTKQIIALALAAVLFALNLPVAAQQAKKVHRKGFLSPYSTEGAKSWLASFQEGLRERGYLDGKNIVVEQRYAGGRDEKLPELAAELVRLKMDIIVTHGGSGVRVIQQASQAIPIVFAVSADPVGEGLVASLARPGGNVTGLSDLHSVIVSKRLELLKEVVPSASRIAFLWNSASGSGPPQLKELQAAAPALGVTLLSFGVKGPDDFDRTFSAIGKERPAALILHGNPLIGTHIRRIAEFAVKSRLPSIYTLRHFVDAGGLMSYGTNFDDMYRRCATYVDKILKGTKPADLPVEQPKKFEFIINLKAAKQIGLTIPPNVLVRADRVIR